MQEADQILIPLLDGSSGLAQVVRINEARALIHLTDQRATPQTDAAPLQPKDVFATIRADRAPLTPDQWPIIGYTSRPQGLVTAPEDLTDGDALDPAIVEAFANALHGLYPWDGFPDPEFFTKLLRDPNTMPTSLRKKADFPTPDDA